MQRKRIRLLLIVIVLLAVLVGLLDYPQPYNRAVGFLNAKFNLKIPRLSEEPFKLGLDLQGGVHLIYAADLSKIGKKNWPEAMAGLRDVIERRVNLFGVKEPVVQVIKAGEGFRLTVELAGVIEPEKAIKIIGQTPFLQFKEPRPKEEAEKILAKQEEVKGKTPEEIKKIKNWQQALEDPYFQDTQLTGRYLQKAELGFDQNTQEPIVLLRFNKEGSKIFEKLTEKNIGKPLAIYIDNMLISSPVVQEKISGGSARITGKFTVDEAKKLARNLSAGALPVPINLISQQQVGPTLGKISLQESLKAGLIGFLAIILFMIIFYRLPGILAGLSLFIYIILSLALFKVMGVTITLAGIGGFILSVGMAIDANILIFSRFREELKEKDNPADCLKDTFLRVWPSIRDGNLTTLIIALILFSFGSSFVKGFALILSLGILVSMFAAMFITRVLMEFSSRTRISRIRILWV